MTKAAQAESTEPEPTEPESTEPEGYPFADDPRGKIDPTDQHAVAAYIDQYGFEAFHLERARQVGTTYGE